MTAYEDNFIVFITLVALVGVSIIDAIKGFTLTPVVASTTAWTLYALAASIHYMRIK